MSLQVWGHFEATHFISDCKWNIAISGSKDQPDLYYFSSCCLIISYLGIIVYLLGREKFYACKGHRKERENMANTINQETATNQKTKAT
jgi:hypothetical protein